MADLNVTRLVVELMEHCIDIAVRRRFARDMRTNGPLSQMLGGNFRLRRTTTGRGQKHDAR